MTNESTKHVNKFQIERGGGQKASVGPTGNRYLSISIHTIALDISQATLQRLTDWLNIYAQEKIGKEK